VSEPVGREEFQTVIARLDEADRELGKAILDTERALRHDYESKIADAVVGVKEYIADSHGQLHEDVGEVKDHLTWQDRTLVAGLITVIALVIAAALTNVFHL